MKASNATSAKAATARPPRTDRLSAQPTPTSADGFSLSGPSQLPDPAQFAYRKDLADAALAGRVIASHYAEPLEHRMAKTAIVHEEPSDDSEAVGELKPGDLFAMLDNSLGWAWGYAGDARRVGYIRSESVPAL